MCKSLLVTSSVSLLLPDRNQKVDKFLLCAGSGADATAELFDGTIGTVATVAVGVAGTGYVVGNTLTLAQAGGSGGVQATVSVATVDGLVGEILTAAVNAAGTGYSVNDVLTLQAVGGGAQATVKVDTVDGGGGVTGITLLTGGSNYVAASSYTVTGGTGNNDATITASTVAVGAITGLTLLTGGSGYVAGTTYATTGGAGTNGTVTVSTITDAGTSIAKLAAVQKESMPADLDIDTFNGVSVRLSGTSAKAYVIYE